LITLSEISELAETETALLGSGCLPCALEGSSRGGNCKVNVLFRTLTNRRDDFLSGGVDNLKFPLVNTLNPLAIDIPKEYVNTNPVPYKKMQ
jgi:hypothetical protein